MELCKVRLAVIVVLGWWLAGLPVAEICAQPGGTDPVLARIGPITVTTEQLRNYAIHRPDLTALADSEKGARKILDSWLEEQLLALYALKKEGKDPFASLPKTKISDLAVKIRKIMREEFPPLPPATDQEVLDYYRKNSDRYTIPVRLHVKKMWFVLEATTPQVEKEAWLTLEESKKAMDSGITFKAAYEAAHEKVSELQSRDLGFLAMDGTFEGQDLVAGLSSGQSTIWRNKEGLFLFHVVERKPGRLEPYENVKDLARADLEQDRSRNRRTAFFERLKKEFGAEVLL
jgi:hypothetical protein